MPQYITGQTQSLDLARDLIRKAPTELQKIATFGDSQETAPAGFGVDYDRSLNERSFSDLGIKPSVSPLSRAAGGAPSSILASQIVGFSDTSTYTAAELRSTFVVGDTGSDQSLGLHSVFNRYINDGGDLTDPDNFRFDPNSIVVDAFVYKHAASPSHARFRISSRDTLTAGYFQTQEGLQHVPLGPDDGWQTVSTGLLGPTFNDTYPIITMRGSDGTSLQNGLVSGGVRWRDSSRSQGMVFDFFSSGGLSAHQWLQLGNTSEQGAQFQAYGPWSAVVISFGANDAGANNQKPVATFAQDYCDLIDMLRGNYGYQGLVILESDLPRSHANDTPATNQLLSQYPAALADVAMQKDNVVAFNAHDFHLANGYDPVNDTSDGVHYTTAFSEVRAAGFFSELIALANQQIFSSGSGASAMRTFRPGKNIHLPVEFVDENDQDMDLPNGTSDLSIESMLLTRDGGDPVPLSPTAGVTFSDPGGGGDVGNYFLKLETALMEDTAGGLIGPTVDGDIIDAEVKAEYETGMFVKVSVKAIVEISPLTRRPRLIAF